MLLNQQLKLLVLAATMLLLMPVHAQNMRGVAFGGYSGITSTLINPALMTGSKVYLDINFIGANAFVQNNMYYFPPQYNTIWNLLTQPGYLINEGGEFKFDRTGISTLPQMKLSMALQLCCKMENIHLVFLQH